MITKPLIEDFTASSKAYAAELVKGLLADDLQRICLKCGTFKRLTEAGSEISDLRDLLDLQLDTIAHQAMLLAERDKEIAALKAIIQADTPASVVDENHPLTWTPTDAERAGLRRIFALGQHFCACECGCENRVDKPDTLCKTCLPF